MQIIIAFVFVVCMVALIAVMRINVKDVEFFTRLFKRKENFKTLAKKKTNRLKERFTRIKAMMKATKTDHKLYRYLSVSLILAAAGAVISVTLDNYFLLPCLSVGLASLPAVYIEFQYMKYNKMMIDELDTALSTITISYERSGNILEAIEENTDILNEPVKSVFTEFVYYFKNINPNYDAAIENMKSKIDNTIFREWCEALRKCSRNRTLRFILQPIVFKLTKVKVVSESCHNIINRAFKDYFLLLGMTAFILYFGIYLLPAAIGVTIPKIVTDILIAFNVTLMYLTSIKVLYEANTLKFDL